MALYLIRHTAVAVAPGTCYGQQDVGLAKSFPQEATQVRDRLNQIGRADACYTSPLRRCTRLAKACGYGAAQRDMRLMEISYGEWEGRLWREIDMGLYATHWDQAAPPHGESANELLERVTSFFQELALHPYQSAYVFTHGGVIACAMAHFYHMTLREAFKRHVGYGEVVQLL